MASFTETSVEVALTLTRDASGASRVRVRARSLSAEGVVVRQESLDVTEHLPPLRREEALSLLDAAVNFFKNRWEIA